MVAHVFLKTLNTPDRWERVIQCETSDRPGRVPFKDVLLDMCEQRNDELERSIEIRLKGALTDLPAADAQYHKKCYNDFMAIPQYTDLNPQTNLCDGDPMKLMTCLPINYSGHGPALNCMRCTLV